MTEVSMPWAGTAVGDGGAGSYDLAVVEDTNKYLQNINPATSGVVYWTTSPLQNLLEPTNPAGSTVRIAAGVGMVEGWVYTNDANVDFDINAAPGNATATDIIVLQRVLASQTVRLARIGGAAASKAVLTQTAATWEIPIADVVLDGAGNFSSLVDARALAYAPGTVVKLGELVGDGVANIGEFSDIPPLFSNLRVMGRLRITAVISALSLFMSLGPSSNSQYDYIYQIADSTPATSIVIGTQTNSLVIAGVTSSTGGTANYFDAFEAIITGVNTPGVKTVYCLSNRYQAGAPFEVRTMSGWRRNLDVVNRVAFTIAGFPVTGSIITLYGEV